MHKLRSCQRRKNGMMSCKYYRTLLFYSRIFTGDVVLEIVDTLSFWSGFCNAKFAFALLAGQGTLKLKVAL